METRGHVTWGDPVSGVRLGLEIDATFATFHVQNVGTKPADVMSHVQAGETHLDWYTLEIDAPGGCKREIGFVDERDRSAPIKVTLAPQAELSHRVDIASWAARPANGSKPLSPGTYSVIARYQVSPGAAPTVWTGTLSAGPTEMIVPKK